jgi:hypothetical protein
MRFLYEIRGWWIYFGLRFDYVFRDPYDLDAKVPVDWEVFHWDKCDEPGSIFKTTGDMALPYCLRNRGSIRTDYNDGSCFYPFQHEVVITYHDGSRRMIP